MSDFNSSSKNIFNNSGTSTVQNVRTGTPQKASLLPLIITISLILISLILTLTKYGKSAELFYYVLGYLATPLAVGMCMGWDSIDQRKKTKNDPWFIPKAKYSLILRILTAASFIVAFPHIHSIAKILSEYLAEFRGQA